MIPCMGGWCRQRDKCAHHVAPIQWNHPPTERLYEKGKDEPEPIKQTKEKA